MGITASLDRSIRHHTHYHHSHFRHLAFHSTSAADLRMGRYRQSSERDDGGPVHLAIIVSTWLVIEEDHLCAVWDVGGLESQESFEGKVDVD